MSEGLIIAIVTVIVGPALIGIGAFVGSVGRQLFFDNRVTWREIAAEHKAEKDELRKELLPALQNLVGTVDSLAEGQDKDRELYERVAPVLQEVKDVLGRVEEKGQPHGDV